MKYKVMGLLLLMVMVSMSYAGTFYIQDMGYSAKYVGSGGMQGFDDAPSGIFSSPAGLNGNSQGLSAFYTTYAQGDVYHYTLATGFELGKHVRIGLGFSELGTTDIPVTEENEAEEYIQTGSFAYYNRMAKLGMSVDLSKEFTFGVGVTGFQKTYYTVTAEGMNMDIGLVWKPRRAPVELAITGHEVLPGEVTYDDGSTESFAALWSISGSYTPSILNALRLYGQVTYHAETEQVSKSFGATWFLTTDEHMYLMASMREVVDLGEVSQVPALGLVMELEPVQFEYALEQSDFVDESVKHYVSLSVRF